MNLLFYFRKQRALHALPALSRTLQNNFVKVEKTILVGINKATESWLTMALHVPKAPGFQSMMKDGSRFFSGLEEAVIRNIGKESVLSHPEHMFFIVCYLPFWFQMTTFKYSSIK